MQVQPASWLKHQPDLEVAYKLLRTCVHCGFCNATCPTYQLLGDELDGPRGRIYQIKSLLEGDPPTVRIQTHLDRCLTCRACETACPSGVRYGRLLDIGRKIVEAKLKRPWRQRLLRWGLRQWVPHPKRLRPWVHLAQLTRPVLPAKLKANLEVKPPPAWPKPVHSRRMLVLDGCIQSVLAPRINAAAAKVLDSLGVSLLQVPQAGCCGALSYHLGAREEALAFMRRNIDAWWPKVAEGVEAIVTTASGCGVMVKEYGELLAHDPDYAAKSATISALAKDLSEVLGDLPGLDNKFARSKLDSPKSWPQHGNLQEQGGPVHLARPVKVAFQSPCTLQHGLRLAGRVESLLQRLGFELTSVPDAHLCCGSAGTYSILQPALARKLRQNKIAALESGDPDVIATANIGCLLYLRLATKRPVVHWIELLADQSAIQR